MKTANKPRVARADHRKALVRLPDGAALAGQPRDPRYIRLPRPGQLCPWSSLNRSKLNRLILPTEENPKPPVASIVVANHGGNKRGVRLIVLASLLAHLRSLESQSIVAA
ncbi:MAG TPA: hypothetical protein VFT34_17480 [Verrucomicrobiae bacterium]|nr:hypothetical protein [Verrucomicrobiae bacterium]